MTSVLHAFRAVGLAAVDLAVGALLFGVTTSPVGLVVMAVGLLVLMHVAYTGLTGVRAALTERRQQGA